MTEENKIFFPLFYNVLELTGSLSDEEFGWLVRELLKSGGTKEYSPSLDSKLMLAYCFILDGAIRIFNTYSRDKIQEKSKKNNKREYNFDPDEAFRIALARSYGMDAEKKKEE